MAAPSWGKEYSTTQYFAFRLGLCVETVVSDTQVQANIQVWFWSQHKFGDNIELFYRAGQGITTAFDEKDTYLVSRPHVSCPSNGGAGWFEDNKILLYSISHTYQRDTSEKTINIFAHVDDVYNYSTSKGGLITVSGNITIPALSTFLIAYDANGGTGAPDSQTKYYGVPATLSSTKPTRKGYTFQGWANEPTGEVVFYAGSKYYNYNYNCTLYAIWKANEYTVTYNGNGGTYAGSETWIDPHKGIYEKPYTTYSNKDFFIRPGYTFVGWNEKADGSGTQDWTSCIDKEWTWYYTRDVTLYAQWKANVLTVNYYTNKDNVTVGEYTDHNVPTIPGVYPTNSKVYTNVLACNIAYPNGLNNLPLTSEGHAFIGYWGTTPDGGRIVNHNTPFASGEFLANALGESLMSDNVTIDLYAVWKPFCMIHCKKDGSWKRGQAWFKDDGVWKRGIPWVKVNGSWKRGGA
ncbi:MAG: InlB B-repeat-containing protein [Clostridia bacterium]|nr:InlB B-repeat-containing protein [Clostridia bacterium]